MTDKTVPNLAKTKADAAFDQGNQLVTQLRRLGLIAHLEPRAVVPDTGTANLAAVQVLANAMKAAWNLHLASTAEHDVADATNVTTAAAATDQATSNTLLNELKTDFNAHVILSNAHGARVAGDGRITTATVATANATDLATSQALAAALLLAINAHFQSGAQLNVLSPS